VIEHVQHWHQAKVEWQEIVAETTGLNGQPGPVKEMNVQTRYVILASSIKF
jgi:hypothetical protein